MNRLNTCTRWKPSECPGMCPVVHWEWSVRGGGESKAYGARPVGGHEERQSVSTLSHDITVCSHLPRNAQKF